MLVRYVATGTLNSAAWLRISQNPSTGNVAATTISGDTPCRSTNVDYRLDTASARSFLGQYVTIP